MKSPDSTVPADWPTALPRIGSDRKTLTIHGYVVAQSGDFKTRGRGRFTEEALILIKDKWPRDGAKSHARHASIIDDRLEGYLGRSRNPQLSTAVHTTPDGQRVIVPAVRVDLEFDLAASNAPAGNLVDYFFQRVGSDADSLSSSLALAYVPLWEKTSKGRPLRDDNGRERPAIWVPSEIYASDIVDTGDAVDGLLGLSPQRELGRRLLQADARTREGLQQAFKAEANPYTLRVQERVRQLRRMQPKNFFSRKPGDVGPQKTEPPTGRLPLAAGKPLLAGAER